MREIWIGNLPIEITEKSLRTTFEIYGTVDNIEIFRKPNQTFAFLRYLKVSQASKAFENVDSLGLSLHSDLKISFSDYLKRNNIVGDSLSAPISQEEMIPFLYLAYSSGLGLPKESYIRDKVKSYGSVESILMRPSYNPNLKSYLLVEFATIDEALEARDALSSQPESRLKKLKLGDMSLEVNVLIGSKVVRPFEANVVPGGGVGGNMGGMGGMGQFGMGYKGNMGGMGNMGGGSGMGGLWIAGMNPQFANVSLSKNLNDDIRMIFDDKHIEKVKDKARLHEVIAIDPVLFSKPEDSEEIVEEPLFSSVPTPKESIKKEDTPPPESPSKNSTELEKNAFIEMSKSIETDYEHFWSGLITQNGKNNVVVDAYFLCGDYEVASNEIFTLTIHNLNTSHRTTIEQALSKPPTAMIFLIPSNNTQASRFNDYRVRFKEKKIVGVVPHFRNHAVYLFPYFEDLSKYDFVPESVKDGNYLIAVVSERANREDSNPNNQNPQNEASAPSSQGDKPQETQATTSDQDSKTAEAEVSEINQDQLSEPVVSDQPLSNSSPQKGPETGAKEVSPAKSSSDNPEEVSDSEDENQNKKSQKNKVRQNPHFEDVSEENSKIECEVVPADEDACVEEIIVDTVDADENVDAEDAVQTMDIEVPKNTPEKPRFPIQNSPQKIPHSFNHSHIGPNPKDPRTQYLMSFPRMMNEEKLPDQKPEEENLTNSKEKTDIEKDVPVEQQEMIEELKDEKEELPSNDKMMEESLNDGIQKTEVPQNISKEEQNQPPKDDSAPDLEKSSKEEPKELNPPEPESQPQPEPEPTEDPQKPPEPQEEKGPQEPAQPTQPKEEEPSTLPRNTSTKKKKRTKGRS